MAARSRTGLAAKTLDPSHLHLTGFRLEAKDVHYTGPETDVKADIRQLSLDAVDWREGILSIQQTKTGRLLTLPLLPDVAEALIAYLRNGRPATDSRHVFVRHHAPSTSLNW